jgi:hypothetical protein
VAIRRVRDLEIDEDLAFERRSLPVERVGIGIMVAVVLAATLGLLGSGPLSHATARGDGLAIEFQRFSRYQSSETLTLRLDESATRAPEVRVWVDRGYLDHSRLETVLPPPVRVEAASDRVVLVFAIAELERPLAISLNLQPERIGPVRGRAGLEDRTTAGAVEFRQFVFP